MKENGDPVTDPVRLVMSRSRTAMTLAHPPDAVYVEVNEAAERLLGWKREHLIGKSVYDTVPTPERDEKYRSIHALLAQDDVKTGERSFVREDGSTFALEWCVTQEVVDGLALIVYMPELTSGDQDPNAIRRQPSARELDVVRCLVLGLTSQEIADELYLSPLTVRTHVRNAMEKLGAQTRAHLVAIAIRDGLVVV